MRPTEPLSSGFHLQMGKGTRVNGGLMTKIATYVAAGILAAGVAAAPAGADKGGVPHNGGGQGSAQAAPAGGCPGGSQQGEKSKRDEGAAAAGDKPAKDHGKTTICHATGSATNPYVEITISNNAIPAHRRHQDGRDIIPAPAEGCPGAAAPATQPAQDQAAAPTGSDQGTPPSAPSSVMGLQ